MNMILNTDSYKVSMYKQYPPGTVAVFSYIESRGGDYDATVFFGLQAFIKEYMTKPITVHDISEAEEVLTFHGLPFNREGWEYILREYHGYLPVAIRAVEEGSVVPVGNAIVTIENTDPKCFWLTTWLETALLRAVWYPTTVATVSYNIKQLIRAFMRETCDNLDGLPFKLHDFGARGVSSLESAGIGGAAHLINFAGTDTISAVLFARKYYLCNMAGFSIPAAEHSTITSWGQENEVKAYENMLNQFAKPGAIVAVVSDSYDIYNAVQTLWGTELKQKVIDSGATIVVRPDSGDPVTVCTTIIELLGTKFGYTVNSKGYKVLNNVRIIQGDGVDEDLISKILSRFKHKKWSADNIAFGMGGALLQKVNRDTMKWAMKCSAIDINGEWVDVFKDPITDSGKRSKKGRLDLVINANGDWETVRESVASKWNSKLGLVYVTGQLIREITFDQIRKNSEG